MEQDDKIYSLKRINIHYYHGNIIHSNHGNVTQPNEDYKKRRVNDYLLSSMVQLRERTFLCLIAVVHWQEDENGKEV